MAGPESNSMGEVRARSLIPSTKGNWPASCYCRWELRPVGSNRGGPCIVLVRIDGGWCDSPCSFRDHVLARLNAGVKHSRDRAIAEAGADPAPCCDPASVVPTSGDRT